MSIADMWNDRTSAGGPRQRRGERSVAHQHQAEGRASHNSPGGTAASGHHAQALPGQRSSPVSPCCARHLASPLFNDGSDNVLNLHRFASVS
jgi:hypothetical protein